MIQCIHSKIDIYKFLFYLYILCICVRCHKNKIFDIYYNINKV